MPKFISIGYGDRDGYDRTDAAVRDAAHAHDARLRKAGILMGVAGTPVQVRNTDAKNIDKDWLFHVLFAARGRVRGD
jgi:hypothetical protein